MNRLTSKVTVLCLVLMATQLSGLDTPSLADNNAAALSRIGEDIRFLSSDDLEGRGPGTKGLQIAAEYIRDRFLGLGLNGAGEEAANMRPFEITIETRVIQARTSLLLRGPDGQAWKLKM